jgi:hypothetical protein
MRDFWLSSGHHLLDRDADGKLLVTDEFLKAYLARPELRPPPESCGHERSLHQSLLAEPRRNVETAEIAAIADGDAQENWEMMIAFRDHLVRHPTLEAAYVGLVRRDVGNTPPLFLNQLVHVILRSALDGCDDPFVLRAAELLFRPQQLTVHEGSLVAADAELISGSLPGPVSPLLSMMGLPVGGGVDVMVEDNATSYWGRSDIFDMALDLTAGRRGHVALGEAIVRFIDHVLGIAVTVEAVVEVREATLNWYVGLDADATQLGDRLWHGEELDEAASRSIVALYRLEFCERDIVIPQMAGQPTLLILAMTDDRRLRMKPQNLIVGLPIRQTGSLS